jgi:hypothetical protein
MRTLSSHISGWVSLIKYIVGSTTYIRGGSTHLMYSQNIL